MLQSRSLGLVASLALAAGLLAPAPALAGESRDLHLGVPHFQFSSFACRPGIDPCLADVTADGTGTSNLGTGVGTVHLDLVVDFFNGLNDPCNYVDETTTFAFVEGTITVESHHQDCALHGLRVDTTFEVIGGTGAFVGATGAGREFGSAACCSAVIYNGTIAY